MNQIIIQWETTNEPHVQGTFAYIGTDIQGAMLEWGQTIWTKHPGATIMMLYHSRYQQRLFPPALPALPAPPARLEDYESYDKLFNSIGHALPGDTMIPESLQKVLQRIENNFTYHRPKDGQQKRYEDIRDKAKELALVLAYNCPESSEFSLALTQLEVVVMWANASIARNE